MATQAEPPAAGAAGSMYDDGEFYSDEESDGEYYEEYETDDELDWDPDRERLIRYVRKTTLNVISTKAAKSTPEAAHAAPSANAAPRPRPVLQKQKSIAERRSEWRAAKGLEEPKDFTEIAAERRASQPTVPRMYDHAGRPLHPDAFMPTLCVGGASAAAAGTSAPVEAQSVSADRALVPPAAVVTEGETLTSSEPTRGTPEAKRKGGRLFTFGFGRSARGTPRRAASPTPSVRGAKGGPKKEVTL